MKSEQFYFEIRDNIREFSRAFDEIVIKRFNEERIAVKDVPVRFIYAPKKRVIYSINKEKNYTLPAIAINVTSYAYDPTRMFNKMNGQSYTNAPGDITAFKQPAPVNIAINMVIVTKYQKDMDQILSNFIPNTMNYFVISLPLPKQYHLTIGHELRCTVKWNGNVSLEYSPDVGADADHYVTATTGFSLETWLFPKVAQSAPIYHVDVNFRDEKITGKIMSEYKADGDPETGDIVDGMFIEEE